MPEYDDGVYGVTFRQWFGLTQKHGGTDAVLTFNESEGTKVTRHYPRGPIKITKMGAYVAATLGKGEEVMTLDVDGARVTQVTASTTAAPYTIASVSVSKIMNAGSYITIGASTNVCSTGSVAVFIDYVPQFQAGNDKWAVS